MESAEGGIGNRIRLRIYIGISGELSSPLLIGSGKEEQTDMDVLMTHDKVPYIPGSALAGVLRNYIENHMGGQEADRHHQVRIAIGHILDAGKFIYLKFRVGVNGHIVGQKASRPLYDAVHPHHCQVNPAFCPLAFFPGHIHGILYFRWNILRRFW